MELHRTYLAVEGQHDVAFIDRILKSLNFSIIKNFEQLDPYWQKLVPRSFPHGGDLLRRVPVPQFFDFDCGGAQVAVNAVTGDTRISDTVQASLAVLSAAPSAIAVVLDADESDSPRVRYDRIRGDLNDVPLPSTPGKVEDGPPRCGGYVMPDNSTAGTLEDVLLECAGVRCPDTLALARTLVEAVDQESKEYQPKQLEAFLKTSGKKKAIVACIGSVLHPGTAVQVSIQRSELVTGGALNCLRVKAFQDFVKKLVLP